MPEIITPDNIPGLQNAKTSSELPEITVDDKLCAFYEANQANETLQGIITKKVSEDQTALEKTDFEDLKKALVEKGLPGANELTMKEISKLYVLTGYEKAITGNSMLTIWTEDAIDLLKKYVDTEKYYSRGPGIEESVTQAQPYLDALKDRLTKKKTEPISCFRIRTFCYLCLA